MAVGNYSEFNLDLGEINAKSQKAFKELYRCYYHRVVYTCVKHIQDRHHAEDFTMEAFTTLFTRKGPPFTSLDELEKLLFLTAKRRCFDYLRSVKRMSDRNNKLLEMIQHEGIVEKHRRDAYYLNLVKLSLDSLPEKNRKLVELVFYNDLKYKEAAAHLKVSLSTVERLHANTLNILREMFASQKSLETLISIILLVIVTL